MAFFLLIAISFPEPLDYLGVFVYRLFGGDNTKNSRLKLTLLDLPRGLINSFQELLKINITSGANPEVSPVNGVVVVDITIVIHVISAIAIVITRRTKPIIAITTISP